MVKICHISSAHPRYDVRIFVKECVSLAQTGQYQVNLIIADGLGDETIDNVKIHDVGLNKHGRLGRMFFTPKKIYKQVLKFNPAIVHFHDPELMLIGIKLAKKGFKVIYDIHENLPKQVLTKYWIPTVFRKTIAFMVNQLELYTAKRITGVISVLDPIIDRFKHVNKNLAVIYNYPILTDSIKSNPVNWSGRKNSLVYVGGISKIRGIEPLVDSLTVSQLQLELAGPFSGDGNLQIELADKPGWQYVNYHGVIKHGEIAKLIDNAKIGIVTLFKIPSYSESLPIKMFEYMLSGIPIIASDIPFWQDLIAKFDCAIFVDPSDSNAIANSCRWLLENEQTAKEMGENGRIAVLKYFNWNSQVPKLLDIYYRVQYNSIL